MNNAPAPSGQWVMPQHPSIFILVALVLAVGVAILLHAAARKPNAPFIYKLRASFFFWLGMGYTCFLMLIAIAYNLAYTGTQPYLVGGMLPIGVPWFGAIGAVTISLEGVFRWNQRLWNPDYNYWHIGRPLFGAVLGMIAFFLFMLILSSSGTTPPFLLSPPQSPAPKDFIIYYVVAFLVGYREETFRELIRRVTDMILKPGGSPGSEAPQIVFRSGGTSVTKLEFPATAPGAPQRATIEAQNAGTASLVAPAVSVRAADSASLGLFAIEHDVLTNLKELAKGQSATFDVVFTARSAGHFAADVQVAGSNLAAPTALSVSGTAR